MKITKKERELNEFAELCSTRYGISMELGYTELSRRSRIQICLIHGILIFLCAYGLLGMFVNSFSLPCYRPLLFLFLFVFSFFMSFLYYNRLAFNLGYIIFFVSFMGFSIAFHLYANSGINAVLNCVMEVVDDKLHLSGVRQYNEIITNRSLTITCCLITINSLLLCLLNHAISGSGSILFTFVILYPIVQLCIYFNDSVHYFYSALLAVGFLGVVFLRASHRYYMPMKGKNPNVVIKKGVIFRRGERFAQTSAYMLLCAVIVSLLLVIAGAGVVAAAPYRAKSTFSRGKDSVDPYVEEFAMSGILAFFNQYQGTGGLNRGRLGGIRSIGFDMQPDLYVDHVPDNTEALYLRAYIGSYYNDNYWSSRTIIFPLEVFGIKNHLPVVNQESNFLKRLMESGYERSAHAKISVTNVDADPEFGYLPYYTMYHTDELTFSRQYNGYFNNDMVNMHLPMGKTKTYEYYPLYTRNIDVDIEDVMQRAGNNDETELLYRKYVYRNYLQIPEKLQPVLERICDEKIPGQTLEEVVPEIIRYFVSEFVYSQQPGITPRDHDFVEYFLTKQKRGFCAHFATAAAMLLREKGIPARYVEGYCITYDDAVQMSELPNENAKDWYQGYNATVSDGEEPRVMRVTVPDAAAHAWVEVYFDGFGWIPLEFTVADYAADEEGGSFWSRFSGLFSDDDDNAGNAINALSEQLKGSLPILFAILIIAVVALLLYIVLRRIVKEYRLYHKKDNSRLVYQYQSLAKTLRKLSATEDHNVYYKSMKELLVTRFGITAESANSYVDTVERASFGNQTLKPEELSEATARFREILRNVKSTLNRRSKLLVSIWN